MNSIQPLPGTSNAFSRRSNGYRQNLNGPSRGASTARGGHSQHRTAGHRRRQTKRAAAEMDDRGDAGNRRKEAGSSARKHEQRQSAATSGSLTSWPNCGAANHVCSRLSGGFSGHTQVRPKLTATRSTRGRSTTAATARRCRQQRYQLVVLQRAGLANRVEDHRLRIVWCIRPPHQLGRTGISGFCKTNPGPGNLVLKRHRNRSAASCGLDLRHVQSVKVKRQFRAMEGGNAPIDRVFPCKKVVVDRRLAFLKLARKQALRSAPRSSRIVKNVLNLLAGNACLNSAIASFFLSPKAFVRFSSISA